MAQVTNEKRRVYVTGASGVFGTDLVDALIEIPGYQLTAITRNEELPSAVYVSDANPFNASWFDQANPDSTIIHLAGLSDPRFQVDDWDQFHKTHTQPHIEMIEKLVESGWRGRLIFASSGGTIYGEPEHAPIPETHPTRPAGAYGKHKLLLETAFTKLARKHDFEVVNLRISNIYGMTRVKEGQGVVPIIARMLRNGETFTLFGDGQSERDYVHVADVIAAIIACVNAPENSLPSVLNIGSMEGTTVLEIIAKLEKRLNKKLTIKRQGGSVTDFSIVLDCALANKHLGWQPKIRLVDYLEDYTG